MALNMNASDLQALSDLLAESRIGDEDDNDAGDRSAGAGVGLTPGSFAGAAAAGGSGSGSGSKPTEDTPTGPYKTVVKSLADLKAESEGKAKATADGQSTPVASTDRGGDAKSQQSAAATAAAKAKASIWDDADVTAAIVDDDTSDGRERASYEMLYKQRVTTGDVYLNMGFKDISAESCESLVVRLNFPNDARASEIDLTVTRDALKAISKTHKLYLPLPHKVDANAGRAQFDSRKRTLIVTLPILWDE